MFILNQIVKGKVGGTFVIIGFRTVAGTQWAQLKTVNPDNHTQHGREEMTFPCCALMSL